MYVDMACLEIVGLKADLQLVVRTLHRLGSVQIDDITDSPEVTARPLALDRETERGHEDLGLLAAKVEGLLSVLGGGEASLAPSPGEDALRQAMAGVDELAPKVQALTTRRDELEAEMASLPRYEATLHKLLPIVPPSAHDPRNMSVGIMVSRTRTGVLESIAQQALDLTGGRGEVVARDVDVSTRAMLVVFPRELAGEVEALLGREDISRLRLPAGLGEGPPDAILATLRRRMAAIPEELKAIDDELATLAAGWRERLASWKAILRDELAAYDVLPRLGETEMTFVTLGWVPAVEVEKVTERLRRATDDRVFVSKLPMTPSLKAKAPVALRNPAPARPFESLVKLLAVPRYGRLDPTRLMAFFLPIFFGLMLGDIGYGALLLVIVLGILRKVKRGVLHDVLVVLAIGSCWAIAFGLLFGEAFGTLGEALGLRPIWFERASAESVAGVLLMSLAVGAVHLTLGLMLGVWEAWRERNRGHLLERAGMLIGLTALFLLVGVLVDLLPKALMTPATAAVIVGIVLVGASMGWLGVVMGPIEFVSLIGNLLSYLRIAAIGLASVYLAKVANDMAGMVGNLIVGVIVAVLIHALNLVMGAFSPTIHSLRLHYVEFFRKFYEGGGRSYEPFKSQLWPQD
ncbi:MAG: V-type ATP synthase subunit I [Chloroflexota bacterium]